MTAAPAPVRPPARVIVSSGRVVPVWWDDDDTFWVVRPSTGRDGYWRANGWHAVAGPFAAADPKFAPLPAAG